jgi:hypothetical protein
MKSWAMQGISLTIVFAAIVLLSEWAGLEIGAPEGAMRFQRLEQLDAAPPASMLEWLPSLNARPKRSSRSVFPTPDTSLLRVQPVTGGASEQLDR